MSDNLKIFQEEFLNADSWPKRKDGVPLCLLDNLSDTEKEIAEQQLLERLSLKDDWPIRGLGHLRSQRPLKKLYELLPQSKKAMKIIIAHAIFQISADQKMIDTVLSEVPQISNQYELIPVVYLLPDFKDERVNQVLNALRDHKEYLVAYNATQAMGLSIAAVVNRFRAEDSRGFWSRLWRKFKGN
ncbi:hypothetical protein [Gilvibacter sediminis]|uniref:hypothetical protein n=1 Tax=Gilvibacter sediminis TaxID=379071 RepID=UPI0023503061|nr:hypothetical protein [Gilvibacter sediminis]MDC7998014.1 hypothetical protein [Gilvibacter sediminis]